MDIPHRPKVRRKVHGHNPVFVELDDEGSPLPEGWAARISPVIDKMIDKTLSYTSDGGVVSLRIGPGSGTHFVGPGVSVEITNHGEEAVIVKIEKAN